MFQNALILHTSFSWSLPTFSDNCNMSLSCFLSMWAGQTKWYNDINKYRYIIIYTYVRTYFFESISGSLFPPTTSCFFVAPTARFEAIAGSFLLLSQRLDWNTQRKCKQHFEVTRVEHIQLHLLYAPHSALFIIFVIFTIFICLALFCQSWEKKWSQCKCALRLQVDFFDMHSLRFGDLQRLVVACGQPGT